MPTRLPNINDHKKAKRPEGPRPSPSKRGYGRNWQRARLAHLAAFPLCAECQAGGGIVEATEVDHRDGDAHNLDPDNLQSLCKPCHSRKTVRENGGLGHARRG